jgi:thiamine-monophosphate kinase
MDIRATARVAEHGPTVGETGERALIERIRARVPAPPPSVIVGIGDDAAVVRPERNALEVVTTDGLVEGVHFEHDFLSPSDIGHKALAVNLSDLAAMGASPSVALLSPTRCPWQSSTACSTGCWSWPRVIEWRSLAATSPGRPAR